MPGRTWSVAAIALALLLAALPAVAQESLGNTTSDQDMMLAGIYSDRVESGADLAGLGTASGKGLSLMGTFHDLRESEYGSELRTDAMLEQAWSAQATPMANIEIRNAVADVANGNLDAEITQWAMRVKGWLDRGGGRSLLIAPMAEMNGDWVPWGMDPINFRAGFRRFVEIFDGIGVDETNVRWVFAPNSFSSWPYVIADYYPGDDLVDFIGISGYNFGSAVRNWQGIPEAVGSALDELRTFAPYKPYLITQVGSSTAGGDRDAWIRELFQLAADDPNVVGLIYFNFIKETDWKIWDGVTVAAGWRDGMQLPTTTHVWPLTQWFQPGPVSFEPFNGIFADDDALAFQADIEWLYSTGIDQGCALALFCPGEPVTREQLATYMVRALHLPFVPLDLFTDDTGSPHEADINAIGAAGISTGCGVGVFCPTQLVTRQELATVLVKALDLPLVGFTVFTDSAGTPYEAAINAVVAAGISTGCSADQFCPWGPVSRAEMAAFLRRSFDRQPTPKAAPVDRTRWSPLGVWPF